MYGKFTNEQFAKKVMSECPFEFLVGEFEYSIETVENLYGTDLYEIILNHALQLTKEEQESFITWHCMDGDFSKYINEMSMIE